MTDPQAKCLAMIAGQLRPNKVNDERLLSAVRAVPRDRFVPASLKGVAYVDEDIPVAPGRYLMEPMIFARLVLAAEISPDACVLDIGAATGYSTAILSHLADTVVAVEQDADLAGQAERKLSQLGVTNAAVLTGPLSEGAADQAPFDIILLNGAVDEVPRGLLDQLQDGGRLACVVRLGDLGRATVFHRLGDDISSRVCFDAHVAPLPGFEAPVAFQF